MNIHEAGWLLLLATTDAVARLLSTRVSLAVYVDGDREWFCSRFECVEDYRSLAAWSCVSVVNCAFVGAKALSVKSRQRSRSSRCDARFVPVAYNLTPA